MYDISFNKCNYVKFVIEAAIFVLLCYSAVLLTEDEYYVPAAMAPEQRTRNSITSNQVKFA